MRIQHAYIFISLPSVFSPHSLTPSSILSTHHKYERLGFLACTHAKSVCILKDFVAHRTDVPRNKHGLGRSESCKIFPRTKFRWLYSENRTSVLTRTPSSLTLPNDIYADYYDQKMEAPSSLHARHSPSVDIAYYTGRETIFPVAARYARSDPDKCIRLGTGRRSSMSPRCMSSIAVSCSHQPAA